MPIGKNAIKRVSNNGYSNVKTEAPDMENSVTLEKPKAAVKKNPAPKADAKKNTAPKAAVTKDADVKSKSPARAKASAKKPAIKVEEKPAVQKSLEKEPELSPITTAEKVTSSPEAEEVGYVNLGKAMPAYLL